MDEFHAVLLLKCYDPSNFEERALRPSPYESRIVETAFFRTRIRLDRALKRRFVGQRVHFRRQGRFVQKNIIRFQNIQIRVDGPLREKSPPLYSNRNVDLLMYCTLNEYGRVEKGGGNRQTRREKTRWT